MRKLKLQIQTTIDGYVAGPNGEQDWMTWNPDDQFVQFIASMIGSSDTLLLGRKMTNDFVTHWEKMARDNPNHPFANKMVDIPKVVFTKTLDTSPWINTTLAKGDLADEITALKNQPGKDIIVYGGAGFASSLIKEGLIDEYHLIMNPVAIGNGLGIFKSLNVKQNFTPVQSKLYPGGKVILSYKPNND
ncbi:MAG: dihydrofolate reductase family protein [Flavobacteriales bacterium]|nr:dihydrofolate reductase family protein [Flavobacteriales bacterium]